MSSRSRKSTEALDTVSSPQGEAYESPEHASNTGFNPFDGTGTDPVEPEAEEGHTVRNGIERKKYSRAPKAPDPFGGHTIQLTEDPEGPKARFLRSNENQAMLIQFNEKQDKETTDYLRSQGFYWEPKAGSDFAQGAWIIKLEDGKEWQNHGHAERVFKETINTIREKNGMPEWVPGAAQGAA